MQSRRHSSWFPLYFLLIGIIFLLVLAPTRVAFAAVGMVGIAALAGVGPVWGVYLTILSVPVQQLVLLPGGFSLTQSAVVLMAGAWAVRTITQPQRALVTGPLFWACLALLAALLLSASCTPYSSDEALRAALRWVVAFLVWFVAVNSVRERWQLGVLIGCLLAAPAATALLGLYQFVSGDGPPSFRIAEGLRFVRAYGTIGQPNSFAGYMNMAWPLALALCCGMVVTRRHSNKEPRRHGDTENRVSSSLWSPGHPVTRSPSLLVAVSAVVFAAATAVTSAALVVSFSLGGWVGALVGAVGLLAALGWRWALAAFGSAGVLLGLLVAGGARLLPGAIGGRVTRLTGMLTFFDPATVTVTPDNFALVERMAQMKAGLLMFLAHPLVGVGPGNYTAAYSTVAQSPWYASRGHAHNFYLHMAAETGALGLFAYLALLAITVVLAVRGLRQVRSRAARSTLIGCCGIIAAVAGHNLFENLHVLNLGVQLSGVWALLVVVPSVERRHPMTNTTV